MHNTHHTHPPPPPPLFSHDMAPLSSCSSSILLSSCDDLCSTPPSTTTESSSLINNSNPPSSRSLFSTSSSSFSSSYLSSSFSSSSFSSSSSLYNASAVTNSSPISRGKKVGILPPSPCLIATTTATTATATTKPQSTNNTIDNVSSSSPFSSLLSLSLLPSSSSSSEISSRLFFIYKYIDHIEILSRSSADVYKRYFEPILLVSDAVLCFLIISYVSYTEIDWKAYMQQVQLYEKGVRNYYNIRGDTGPLVYPAGFIYIFSWLKSMTDDGTNILKAQWIFLIIYLIQLSLVLVMHRNIVNRDVVVLSLLALSRRLHSIYILRCFNDCVAIPLMYGAVVLGQNQQWIGACCMFSLALSVKMNILLFAPGLLWLLWDQASSRSVVKTCLYLAICGTIQVVLGLPFITTFPKEYIHKAFEFSRVFTYIYTVNWRFLPEWLFLSKGLSFCLLMGHGTLLIALWSRGWWRHPSNTKMTPALTQTYILYVFLSSNFVGILCSRSMHYQFYSWYAMSVPFFLCQMNISRGLKLAVWFCLEYCWNVYPQTAFGSFVMFIVHIIIMVGIFTAPVVQQWRQINKSNDEFNKSSYITRPIICNESYNILKSIFLG